MYEEDSHTHYYFYILFSVTIISVCSNLGLLLILNRKKSNYARIMRHIIMSEAIFIFCYMLCITNSHFEKFNDLMCSFLCNLTPVKYPNCTFIFIIKKAAFHGNEAFSIILNFFICLETILVLKNPIAMSKGRIKIYFILSSFIGIFNFVIDIILYHNYSEIFASRIPVIINIALFLAFGVISFISFLYLMARFCVGRSLLANLKNIFVVRHSLYVGTYFALLLPNKINGLLYKSDDENFRFIQFELSEMCSVIIGFVMFLIRASETNFYSKLFCRYQNKKKNNLDQSIETGNEKEEITDNFFEKDEPLTNIISKHMNLEFMCCILYGLSEIFSKTDKRKLSNDETTILTRNKSDIFFSNNSAESLIFENSKKDIDKKDYRRAKSHQIYYKKLFNDNIDFESFGVQVHAEDNTNNYFNTNYNYSSDNDSVSDLIGFQGKENHNAKIIEYFPRVFRDLRKLDDIDGNILKQSLDPILNKERMDEIKEGEGKSGSFFFFSHDRKFLIKTVTDNELKTMKGNFMIAYHKHMSANEDSLLARIYGVYSVVIRGVSQINFILMQNLISFNISHIKRIFDLKGSRIQRYTKNIEKCNNMKTLKDLDYLWMIECDRHVKFFILFLDG